MTIIMLKECFLYKRVGLCIILKYSIWGPSITNTSRIALSTTFDNVYVGAGKRSGCGKKKKVQRSKRQGRWGRSAIVIIRIPWAESATENAVGRGFSSLVIETCTRWKTVHWWIRFQAEKELRGRGSLLCGENFKVWLNCRGLSRAYEYFVKGKASFHAQTMPKGKLRVPRTVARNGAGRASGKYSRVKRHERKTNKKTLKLNFNEFVWNRRSGKWETGNIFAQVFREIPPSFPLR